VASDRVTGAAQAARQTPLRVFLTESSKPFHTDLYELFYFVFHTIGPPEGNPRSAVPPCKEFPNERRMRL
jgi:hypothetical protein